MCEVRGAICRDFDRFRGSAPLKTTDPIVAHALLRAVFALLRTRFLTNSKRSQECERGTQECVFITFGGPQAHGHSVED
jgi:hypothetical protein